MSDKLAFSISEAAKLMSVSKWMVKKEIYEGRLIAVKFGTRTVIPKWSMEERLKETPSSTNPTLETVAGRNGHRRQA